jgi:hypothetical protein
VGSSFEANSIVDDGISIETRLCDSVGIHAAVSISRVPPARSKRKKHAAFVMVQNGWNRRPACFDLSGDIKSAISKFDSALMSWGTSLHLRLSSLAGSFFRLSLSIPSLIAYYILGVAYWRAWHRIITHHHHSSCLLVSRQFLHALQHYCNRHHAIRCDDVNKNESRLGVMSSV